MGRARKKLTATDADDVLAGRRPARIDELFELIHAVNPTDRRVDEGERAAAYAVKARLQSVLIERFGEFLVVDAADGAAGVVGLRHRTYAKDACHAVLRELSGPAQAWVRLQRDLRLAEDTDGDATGAAEPAPRPAATAAEPSDSMPHGRADALARGEAALSEWDFEQARSLLQQALGEGPVDGADALRVQAARVLLRLLVDHLVDDAAAWALRADLGGVHDPEVRCLLALAAARSGEAAAAEKAIDGVEHERRCDVVLALAELALTTRDLAAVDRLLARVRPGSEHHGRALEVAKAAAGQRAAAVEPLERQLDAAFVAGDRAGAEELLREVRALHPQSDVARRVQAELRRAQHDDEVAQLAAWADHALRAGDPDAARAHVLRLEVLGASPPELAARVAEAMARRTAEREQAEIAALTQALGGDVSPRVVDSLWSVSDRVRALALAGVDRDEVTWLVDLGAVRGQAACAAAAAAARDLAHAECLSRDGEVDAALDLAARHEALARQSKHGAALLEHLRAEVTKRRRADALECLQAAEDALGHDPTRAADLLGRLDKGALDRELHARVQHVEQRVLSMQRMVRARQRIADTEAAGDWLAARATVRELLLEDDNTERDALLDKQFALTERIRALWVEATARGADVAREIDLLDTMRKANVQVFVTPDGEEVVFADVSGTRVLVMVLNLSAVERSRAVLLRTPDPMEHVDQHVDADSITLFGALHMLRLQLDPLEVDAWQSFASLGSAMAAPDAVLVIPGERYLWLTWDDDADDAVAVVDRQRWTKVHNAGAWDTIVPLHGSTGPVVAVGSENGNDIAFLNARGVRTFSERGRRVFHTAVLDPAARGIVVLYSEPRSAADGAGVTVLASLLTCAGEWLSSFELGVANDAVGVRQAATASTCGCVFVAASLREGGDLLLALTAEGDGFAEVWRTPFGRSASLAQDATSRHVRVLTQEDTPVRVLDRQRPQFAPPAPRLALPNGAPFHTCRWAAALADRVQAYACVWSLLDAPTAAARLADVLTRPLERDDLLALYQCAQLARLEEPVWERLARAYGSDPVVVMLAGERLTANEEYEPALNALAVLDLDTVDRPIAQHVRHIRGLCHLALGNEEDARRELQHGLQVGAHACDLDRIAQIVDALLDPIDDAPRAGDRPVYEFVRSLRRADAARARGDLAAAHRELEHRLVRDQDEPQAWARLADLYLQSSEAPDRASPRHQAHAGLGHLRQAWVLAEFVTAMERPLHWPLLLGQATWSVARIDAIEAAARAWLDGRPAPEQPRPPRARERFPAIDLPYVGAFVLTRFEGVPRAEAPGRIVADAASARVIRAHEQRLCAEARALFGLLSFSRLIGLVLDPSLPSARHYRRATEHILARVYATPETALVVTIDTMFAILTSSPRVFDSFQDFHSASVHMGCFTIVLVRQDGVALHRVGWHGAAI